MRNLIRKRKYLQFLIRLYNNFDYNTKDNDGIYSNKIKFIYNGIDYKVLTKRQLKEHIAQV